MHLISCSALSTFKKEKAPPGAFSEYFANIFCDTSIIFVSELQSCRVSQNILEIYFLSDKIQNIKLNQRTFSSSNNIPDLDLISETLLRWVGRITRKTFYNVGVELENDYQESFI